MSQFNRNPYPTDMMNEQQFNQINYAFNSYCKVMRVPKLGAAPVVITVLEGLVLTLIITALGVRLWVAIAIGATVSAVFAFLLWLLMRYRRSASKRFNSFLTADGGQGMLIDFASAQPIANDQFRLGRYYLCIKNGAVLRRDSITDVVSIPTHTCIGLNATVNDENGKMSFLICRLHGLSARANISEIRNIVLQR